MTTTCASDPCESVKAGEAPDMRMGDTCLMCLCRECERCGKSIDIDEENQIKHVPDREHPHDYGYWDVCDDCLFDSDVLYDDELEAERRADPFDYDRPTHTHRVVVTFDMEEMNGTPEESAEVLLDLYVADEVTVLSVDATEVTACTS